MTRLVVRRPHALAADEARARVAAAAVKISERFGARCEWQGDLLAISHAAVNGTVAVGVDEIVVDARLGLALAFARRRAEAEITRILDRELTR
jgi:putative polyhydroxyalkanoate system protein